MLSNEDIIKEAVYNIIYKDLYFKNHNQKFQLSKSSKAEVNSNFRIKKAKNNTQEPYYYLQNLKNNKILILSENNEVQFIEFLEDDKKYLAHWNFIKWKQKSYIIGNSNNCFLKLIKFILKCENITMDEATKFDLVEIYEEVEIKELENRTGIHQIEKDLDNEEIRYSVRSILKNIPWIRTIFILMPNEKVRYFKDYDLIKEKIVYVKDKDLIGFDSSNSLSFQFRYWNMKRFGISDNFIVMDDDYFIGAPLKKSDFFYVNNNKVIPSIITSNFIEIDEHNIRKYYNSLKLKLKKDDQTSESFDYSICLTYLFFLKMFNKKLIIPKYTHNAMPVNLKELKEVYDIIYESKYNYTTLFSTYRHVDSFQFQAFIFAYTFLKYNRKVRYIPYKYIQNKNSLIADYNTSLFCINTGSIYYSPISFLKTKIIMEYLFPFPTPYEIIDNSFPYISFNVVYTMETEINKNKIIINDLIKIKTKLNHC